MTTWAGAALAASLATGAVTLAEARAALEKGTVDELYVEVMAQAPTGEAEADAQWARVLGTAAELAQGQGDPIVALGLAEVALRHAPADGRALGVYVGVNLDTDGFGPAVRAADAALAADPKSGDAHYWRAEVAAAEGDIELARRHLGQVPKKHARRKDADTLLASLGPAPKTPAPGEKLAAGDDLAARLAEAREKARTLGSTERGVLLTRGTYDEESGAARRASTHFVLTYPSWGRDGLERDAWGEKVLAQLESARAGVANRLGLKTEEEVEVIAHTPESYQRAFARTNPGLFDGRIHLNVGDDPDTRLFYAVVVHEYIHAVIYRSVGVYIGKIPSWFNEGLAVYLEYEVGRRRDGHPRSTNWRERQVWPAARAITLEQLSRQEIFHTQDPSAAYAKARAMVSVLIENGNYRPIRELIERVKAGMDFEKALRETWSQPRIDGLEVEANRRMPGDGSDVPRMK